jgi:hypothetical protein
VQWPCPPILWLSADTVGPRCDRCEVALVLRVVEDITQFGHHTRVKMHLRDRGDHLMTCDCAEHGERKEQSEDERTCTDCAPCECLWYYTSTDSEREQRDRQSPHGSCSNEDGYGGTAVSSLLYLKHRLEPTSWASSQGVKTKGQTSRAPQMRATLVTLLEANYQNSELYVYWYLHRHMVFVLLHDHIRRNRETRKQHNFPSIVSIGIIGSHGTVSTRCSNSILTSTRVPMK